MADRDMTCPLDGMFATRNAGELVSHEPAKTTIVRAGMGQDPTVAQTTATPAPVTSAASQTTAQPDEKKLFGLPLWAVVAIAAGGAYLLAKK